VRELHTPFVQTLLCSTEPVMCLCPCIHSALRCKLTSQLHVLAGIGASRRGARAAVRRLPRHLHGAMSRGDLVALMLWTSRITWFCMQRVIHFPMSTD
jgi:hypothetical protein